jgi:predicted nucleic acid-binding protein
MRLVVNTSKVVAALIKNSLSRQIIMSGKFELITVGFAKAEIKKHKAEILNKSHLQEAEFERLISIIFKKIYVVSDYVIRSKKIQARKIMDKIDPDDSPFIALALSVVNDGIWTDDHHFMQQKEIKIWRTKDLLKRI